MKNLRYVEAECYAACDDPQCPYIHRAGWTCDEVKGQLFDTPNDIVREIGPILRAPDHVGGVAK